MSSDRFTVLCELTDNISLVKLTSTSACWISGDLLRPTDRAVALHFDGVSRLISIESRSQLASAVQDPSTFSIVERIQYEKPILHKGTCLICDSDVTEGDIVYSFSEFQHSLETWIHEDCANELVELLQADLSGFEPQILSHTI